VGGSDGNHTGVRHADGDEVAHLRNELLVVAQDLAEARRQRDEAVAGRVSDRYDARQEIAVLVRRAADAEAERDRLADELRALGAQRSGAGQPAG